MKNMVRRFFNMWLLPSASDLQWQMMSFGIIMAINYPLYYFIWDNATPVAYENLPLRLFASTLCLFLIIAKYWPLALQRFLLFYWYITVWFSVAFFFSFMSFHNHGSVNWLMNCMSALFFLMILFDVVKFLFITLSGVLAAWIVFSLTSPVPFSFIPGTINAETVLATLLGALFVGGVFALSREKIEDAKLATAQSIAATIAHEMRTPLRAIDNGISGIKEYLPKLIQVYEKAKADKQDIPFIHPMHYQALIANSESLGLEVRQAFLVIDMLLMKAKQQKMDPNKFTTHSMREVVKTALERYPFTPEEQAMVHVDIQHDFQFKGDELAIVHVFFNLLKNALHYIKSANKGKIYITTTLSGKFNELHFKDTGPGISTENLAKLFDAFFTSGNAHGTGLGLAFCKMVMQGLGGDITCDSVEGELTEFVLRFPIVS